MTLDASAYLLMAESHLRKARKELSKTPYFTRRATAVYLLRVANNDIKTVRELLKTKEEESCKP